MNPESVGNLDLCACLHTLGLRGTICLTLIISLPKKPFSRRNLYQMSRLLFNQISHSPVKFKCPQNHDHTNLSLDHTNIETAIWMGISSGFCITIEADLGVNNSYNHGMRKLKSGKRGHTIHCGF
ncbi:hypothetical protein YC2023_042816 [Brassica napus]